MKAKDNKLDDNILHSNTSLPSIADENDLFFLKNENLSNKIPHNNAFATLPQHDLIPNNNTSTMRPLGKAEHQKISNSVAYNYSNCSDALKLTLGGMIVAMEKSQIQGDALCESDSATENDQNKETVLSMFQDIANCMVTAFQQLSVPDEVISEAQ